MYEQDDVVRIFENSIYIEPGSPTEMAVEFSDGWTYYSGYERQRN